LLASFSSYVKILRPTSRLLIPGLPPVELRPDYVFLIVLPPLLYAQAWFTSWKDFCDHLRPITMLAVGLAGEISVGRFSSRKPWINSSGSEVVDWNKTIEGALGAEDLTFDATRCTAEPGCTSI